MANPRFMRSRSFKFSRRASTSLTTAVTTWANVDTALDLVLECQTGDVVEYGVNGAWSSEAVVGVMDVVTIVAAAPVNALGQSSPEPAGNDGAVGWIGPASATTGITGSLMYTLVAGDIAAGTVTLRLRFRAQTAATKTLLATAVDPLQVWAKILGPAQPF